MLPRQMETGAGPTGLKQVIEYRAHKPPPPGDYSPLSAAAFSRPVSTLIDASLDDGFDRSSVDPVPLMMEIFCEGGDPLWIPGSREQVQGKNVPGKKRQKAPLPI
jgi:hypothetical protein